VKKNASWLNIAGMQLCTLASFSIGGNMNMLISPASTHASSQIHLANLLR